VNPLNLASFKLCKFLVLSATKYWLYFRHNLVILDIFFREKLAFCINDRLMHEGQCITRRTDKTCNTSIITVQVHNYGHCNSEWEKTRRNRVRDPKVELHWLAVRKVGCSSWITKINFIRLPSLSQTWRSQRTLRIFPTKTKQSFH